MELLNNTETPEEEEKQKKKITFLLYFQSTTERIGRILSKHNIKGIFKPQIFQLFPNPKDQRPRLKTPQNSLLLRETVHNRNGGKNQ